MPMTSTRLPAQESAEPDDSLSVLLGNPERVEALPLQSVAALLAAVTAKQASLTALQGLLVRPPPCGGLTPPDPPADPPSAC